MIFLSDNAATTKGQLVKIGSGLYSDVYLIDDERVLKVFKQPFFKYAEVEYKKTLLAGELGIPVPKVYGVTVTDSGNPAIEMEYVHGLPLKRYLIRHPARYPLLLSKLAELSVRLENIPYIYSEADASFASEQLDKKRFTAIRIGHIAKLGVVLPEEIAIMERFYDSIPESRYFVHGDIGPSNVIVFESGNRIYLIDYGLSGFGSWLFDLTRMYEKYYDTGAGRMSRKRSLISKFVFRYYLWAYLRAAKRSTNISRSMNTKTIIHTLGAMINIERLIACTSFRKENNERIIRIYADRVLECIASLPGGVFPKKGQINERHSV